MEFKVLYEFFIQSYLIVLYRSECPTTTTNNNKGGVTTVKKKYFQDLLSQIFCQINLNNLFSSDNLLF